MEDKQVLAIRSELDISPATPENPKVSAAIKSLKTVGTSLKDLYGKMLIKYNRPGFSIPIEGGQKSYALYPDGTFDAFRSNTGFTLGDFFTARAEHYSGEFEENLIFRNGLLERIIPEEAKALHTLTPQELVALVETQKRESVRTGHGEIGWEALFWAYMKEPKDKPAFIKESLVFVFRCSTNLKGWNYNIEIKLDWREAREGGMMDRGFVEEQLTYSGYQVEDEEGEWGNWIRKEVDKIKSSR